MGFYPLPLTAQTEAAAAALEQQEKRRGEHEGTYSRSPYFYLFTSRELCDMSQCIEVQMKGVSRYRMLHKSNVHTDNADARYSLLL